MPKNPLVSVMMPCYNASKTLPLALASLVAQTYTNWECILVDDGSKDKPYKIVAQINDPRIRYIRLEKNMGRGFARQIALDKARGEYLCMLDADDWIFSTKIENQVKILKTNPQISLCSTGMCIVDHLYSLIGIRSVERGKVPFRFEKPMQHLSMPPIAYAPSMIRLDIARDVSYDQNFTTVEDVDFLLNILLNNAYCILNEASYVYTEYATVSLPKVLEALKFSRYMFMKHRNKYYFEATYQICYSYIKTIIYWIGFHAGMKKWLIKRRSISPSQNDIFMYKKELDNALSKYRNIFGGNDLLISS